MSLLNKINLHSVDLMSRGLGSGEFTREDVLSAIPNTDFGRILISHIMQEIPPRKYVKRIRLKCINHYKELRLTNKVKTQDQYTLDCMFKTALDDVIRDKFTTTRDLSKKLCEAHTTFYLNQYPIYKQFCFLISDGLIKSIRRTIYNLKNE